MTRAQLQERLTQDFLAANAANEPCDAFLTAMQSLNGWDEHAPLPVAIVQLYPDLDLSRSAEAIALAALKGALQRAKLKLKLTVSDEEMEPPTLDEFNEGLAALKVLYESGTPEIRKAATHGELEVG